MGAEGSIEHGAAKEKQDQVPGRMDLWTDAQQETDTGRCGKRT